MGFSNQERINLNSKALAANVIDANPIAQWYETRNPFAFLLSGTKILTQLSLIPAASSLSAAGCCCKISKNFKILSMKIIFR